MVNNTEKNEQEQTIHYPFGGFYRKLLPAEETATTAEQTAQATPIPTPADDAPQDTTEATESTPRWVADVIGEDYKTWGKGKVAIEATTGTGKTSFVMGPLMDWALAETVRVKIPRQMLILCNRRALKADIMAKFEARCKPHIFMNEFGEPDCLAYDIVTIATYQYFEKRLKHPTGLSVNDSLLFDLIPPIWLDFVPTGSKERQGEGTFTRDQRVKFRAPL